MKQTAAEWLEKNMQSDMTFMEILGLIRNAKEMEKQQIIDAHGNQTKKSRGISNYTYILTGEEYYNQTFKNK
jgi:hypothetical protein